MGSVRSSKTSRGKQRVEPKLFSGRSRSAKASKTSRISRTSTRPVRPRRGFVASLLRKVLLLGAFGAFGLAAVFGYIWLSLNENGLLTIPDREPGVLVLAADGTVLAEQGAFNGDEARLSELPSYVPNAVIAIEDRRFYGHFGVDPIGLARAIYVNYRAGRLVQGGSTLTQQLAKNLFLKPDRTLERKVQELLLAFWLEHKYSKDAILEMYLNRVYFGSGAYGVEAASRRYFNKPARDVTLAEAALLAGLLKAPTRLSPARFAPP